MATISQALLALRPGSIFVVDNNSYAGITWLDEVQTKPTEEEVDAKIVELDYQAPFKACSDQAKYLIAKTDWSVLSDVGLANVSEYIAYRATLRNYIKNPVVDPVWPTEPQPVWA